MSSWPQYITILALILRFILQIGKHMERPSPREMWAGTIGSVLALIVPLWVLYMGGFFRNV